jgi:hypothetical protein
MICWYKIQNIKIMRTMKNLTIKYSLFLGILVFLTGCFGDSGQDILWTESMVTIEEAGTAAGAAVTNAYDQQDEGVPTPTSVTIGLASATLNQPVTVTFEVGGSAIEGVHYNMITSGNTVTIPAGEHFAEIEYEILTYNITPDELIPLTFTITGATGAEVSANYATFTNNIRTLCPSEIPLGTYIETTDNAAVELTRLGSNTYRLSQMNFRYYDPGYADIPGDFSDVCDQLTLLGNPVGAAYGIAWIGTGTWDEDTQILTFEVSDATYNPDYVASMAFQYQP